jgi:plastocyanin
LKPPVGYIAVLSVLLILGVASLSLYFANSGNANSGPSSPQGETTATSTVTTAVTTTVTSRVTIRPANGALAFNGTLVIIPNGVSANTSLNFTPSTIRVVVGVNNTITWLNQDTRSQHTVVTESVPSGAQSFSVVIGSGQTYATTLSVPGTYRYFCMWHPGWMKATIVVLNG